MVQTLDGGCVLHVRENQAVLKLGAGQGWTAISSAVLNGGVQHLPLDGGHVINSTVPADYDGYSPEPESLLIEMAEDRGVVPSACIGASTLTLPLTLTLTLTSTNPNSNAFTRSLPEFRVQNLLTNNRSWPYKPCLACSPRP